MILVPLEFYDAVSCKKMKIDFWPGKDETSDAWIFYKHRDGQWVSLRKATQDDIERIQSAIGTVELQTGKLGS